MLVIKIELHSAVTGQVTTIAIGKIVNTGTGSPTQGNYRIELRDAAGRGLEDRTHRGFPPQTADRMGFAVPGTEKNGRKSQFDFCAVRLPMSLWGDNQPNKRSRTMIAQLPNLDALLKRHKIHPKFWPEMHGLVEEGHRPCKELRTRLHRVATTRRP